MSQNQNAPSTDKFYDYLQELDQSYSKLADLLRQKQAAVTKFDLNKLEEIMKEEQVYVLLSKGFDANLETYREKLGLTGENLGEAIDSLPDNERDRFRQLHKRLKKTLDDVKNLNQACQKQIEDRLYSLDRSIKSLDKTEGVTYYKGGGPGSPKSGGNPSLPIINKSI